jgi:hypothetical protein
MMCLIQCGKFGPPLRSRRDAQDAPRRHTGRKQIAEPRGAGVLILDSFGDLNPSGSAAWNHERHGRCIVQAKSQPSNDMRFSVGRAKFKFAKTSFRCRSREERPSVRLAAADTAHES